MKKEWFEEWFDSPYYHTLYKHHDAQEAKRALDNLLSALQLPSGARILDLACGKGRHSRYLAGRGYDVTGIDISEKSISYARQHETDRLAFYQHDMRLPFRINYFDAVMNMFTSFGYFRHDSDHLLTLKNVWRNLKPGGLFLLDYFNSQWVRGHLVPADTKTVEHVTFRLKRHIRKGYVYKKVEFIDGNRYYWFRERVRLFSLKDFETLFMEAGMPVIRTYGAYDLTPFDPEKSTRLILIGQKKAAV
ncbi:MAG: class I SAM-dependent methyltransferase [Saprospiraceae bacterium]